MEMLSRMRFCFCASLYAIFAFVLIFVRRRLDMATKKISNEIQALSDVLTALSELDDEKEKVWVLETAASRIGVGMGGARKPGLSGSVGEARHGSVPGANATAKDFMREKDPKNDVQRVAALAFYLTNHRGTAQFKSRDLANLNTEAAGPKINMSRAVNNAQNQNGYLATAGSGNKQITALGEDIVNALPNQEAVKAAEEQKRPRRRKKKTGNKTGKK
jgi:hypothetical protein